MPPQVSVRDIRGEDRPWIQQVYRQYLTDLVPSASGAYPLLPEMQQREHEQLARLFAEPNARLLTLCYSGAPVGFAKIRRGPAATGALPPAAVPAHPGGNEDRESREGRGSREAAPEYALAEFFIAEPWRRRGIGSQAVRLILDRFQGRWLITENVRNEIAVRFWRRVVSAYTAGAYQERIVNGEVQQRFESGSRRAPGRP